MRKILIYFSAGCVGALANSLVVWIFGEMSITKSLGVYIAPSLSPAWLYPRIVWGGIWGLLFIIPLLNAKFIKKGSVISLVPTIVQLFIVFPYKSNKGMAGMELGTLTPLFVIFFNWIWGLVTAITIKFSK